MRCFVLGALGCSAPAPRHYRLARRKLPSAGDLNGPAPQPENRLTRLDQRAYNQHMAIETISTLFSALGTAANTTKAFRELLTNKKGDVRLLLEELKRNSTLSWLAVRREVVPQKIIPQLSTKTYDELLQKGFNFNDLSPKKKKISGDANLENSDLASFIGKDVAQLVEGIYDRIKEVQLIFQVDPENKHIDWNRRIINLNKRILLLMMHLRGRID